MIARVLWGVWNKRSAVHVCPVDAEGYAHTPHELTIDCRCGTIVDYENEKPIVIHDLFENEVG